jgi:hypothetical protein
VDALAAARRAKMEVPDAAFANAARWYDSVTSPNGAVGYHKEGDRGFNFGDADRFVVHEILTMTRVAALAEGGGAGAQPADPSSGSASASSAARARALLLKLRPSTDVESLDYLYWHQGMRALQAEWPRCGGPARRWAAALQRAAARVQSSDRQTCAAGSWTPEDRWSGYGGRVYATALGTLTLQRMAWALEALAREAPAEAAPAERERLRGLVRRLGSDAYDEREEASRALLEAGDAAEPFLREAAGSDDAEVRIRARAILNRLGLLLDGE